MSLIEHISRYVELTEKEINLIKSYCKIIKVKKRQCIVQPGFICKYKSYVIKGAFKTYLVDNDGKEHTLSLAIEDWWASDYNSVVNQEPATLFVEALENSVVIQIANDDDVLFKEIPPLERFERIIAQRSLAFHQKRLLNSLTKTAEERYNEYMDRYAAVARRVPQYVLASYLGISTEYLSKIRKVKPAKS